MLPAIHTNRVVDSAAPMRICTQHACTFTEYNTQDTPTMPPPLLQLSGCMGAAQNQHEGCPCTSAACNVQLCMCSTCGCNWIHSCAAVAAHICMLSPAAHKHSWPSWCDCCHRLLLGVEDMAVAGMLSPLLLTAATVNAYSTPGTSLVSVYELNPVDTLQEIRKQQCMW
jgi:hypothetical protein